MREGWREVPLGNVFALTSKRAREVREPPVLSITKYDGVVLAADYFDKRIASDAIANYKVLEPEDWAYSTIHIDEGSIARNNLGFRGAVSPMYTTLRFTAAEHDPRYFELLLRTGRMLARYKDAQQGSINRRRSLPWKVFCGIGVTVPALREQRRIIDLIAAIDDTISSSEVTARNARRSATSFLAHPTWEIADTVPLESVFEHVIGGTWGDPPGVSEVPVLALGPKSYAGRVEVDADTATQRSLSGKRAAERILRAGDIVLERSGGSPTQPVGRVIRMRTEQASNVVPSDFQRLLRPDPSKAHPGFVFWSMWANYESGAVVPFQKATTSIRNLNIPQYLAQVRIALPASAEQVRFAALAESFAAVISGYEQQGVRLRELRSNLLSALLSGEHAIPESYDELMGVAS